MKETKHRFPFNFSLFVFFFACLGVAISEAGSIKNNKLCKTKPIYEEPKMTLNHYITKDYENKSGLLTREKQTQTNPISKATPASSGTVLHRCITSVPAIMTR